MSNIRTTCPAKDNKYYMNGGGGYNKCLKISGNYVLHNCVGYAYGRFMEKNGMTSCKLSAADAKKWYGHTSDGYKRSKTPVPGAVICWTNSQWGHVAIVEEVYEDGSILISQSGYTAKKFWTQKLKKGYKLSGYTLQGFILPPENVAETKKPVAKAKKSVAEIAKEVIAGKWGNGSDRKKKLTDAGYNYSEVQKEVNRLLK